MTTPNTKVLLIRQLDKGHVVQRGEEYWTGAGWAADIDRAKPYSDHRDARRECLEIQRQIYKGLPARTFSVEAVVTLVAPNVEQIGMDRLSQFLDAVWIDAGADGPVDGSFVAARLRLGTLRETERAGGS